MENKSVFHKLEKVNNFVGEIERIFCVVVLIALIISCMIFITCRYVIHISVPWSDEISRFVLVALGWIGAAYCNFHHDHLTINAMSSVVLKKAKNPEKILTILQLIIQVMIGCFMIFFLRNFLNYLTKTLIPMNVVTPSLRVKNWIPTLVIPLAAVLIIFHSFMNALINLGMVLGKLPMKEYKTEEDAAIEEGA